MRDRVVPGEEELGVQRRCRTCSEFLPLDDEFYGRNAGRFRAECRACRAEQASAMRRIADRISTGALRVA